MRLSIPLLFCASLLTACYTHIPRTTFDPAQTPQTPDYADLSNWAAHPDKTDPADRLPCKTDARSLSNQVDVFFIYPTTLTGNKRGENVWNGDVKNRKLNAKTDSSTILYQASIFNSAGRVFAPRYRQAHLRSFFSPDKTSSEAALTIAYADVQASFQYYLDHWNNGRPFIIAGHSQGGRHGMYLVRDRIENQPLEKQMVAAYLVGWPVKAEFFNKIKPCESPDETGCFCSWRTWERHFGQKKAFEPEVVCTNPLNWSTKPGQYVAKSENKGGIVRDFCKEIPELADAEVYKGILLCTKPKFPGSVLFIRKNYHVGDLNLYYFNVRENALLRSEQFLKK